jgi:hypothetical protein
MAKNQKRKVAKKFLGLSPVMEMCILNLYFTQSFGIEDFKESNNLRYIAVKFYKNENNKRFFLGYKRLHQAARELQVSNSAYCCRNIYRII